MRNIAENVKFNPLYTILLLCLLPFLTEAGVFTSRNSGNWMSPCTWSNSPTCAGLVPIEGVTIPGILDDVVISGKDIVTATTNVYINSLTLNNGSGADKTTLQIFGDIDFIISANLKMESQTIMLVDGGAFINVKGDICVKNDGNIAAQGLGPLMGGSFIVNGCATVGATNCVSGGSGTPNFINSTFLIYCIACAANSANMYEGTPGACYGAMPVELLYFRAEYSGSTSLGQARLLWLTAKEVNNAFFTVERSADGINFNELLRIEAVGEAMQPTAYQAADTDPLPGYSYYRLKQTDKDGKSAYSKTVVLKAPNQFQIRLSPNPLKGNSLSIQHTFNTTFSVSLYDMLGKPVPAQNYILEYNPVESVLHFHQALLPGIYTIKLSAENGTITKKLVIQ